MALSALCVEVPRLPRSRKGWTHLGNIPSAWWGVRVPQVRGLNLGLRFFSSCFHVALAFMLASWGKAAHNKLNGSISTNTAVCGISFASQNANAPLRIFVNTDFFGDFNKN